MMKIKIALLFIGIIIFYGSCEKEATGNGEPSEPLVFESLQVDKTTLIPGETAKLTAIATGYQLSYYWSATQGDILGKGAEVIYAPSFCHVGENTITCEVKDGNGQSESKTVTIVVE